MLESNNQRFEHVRETLDPISSHRHPHSPLGVSSLALSCILSARAASLPNPRNVSSFVFVGGWICVSMCRWVARNVACQRDTWSFWPRGFVDLRTSGLNASICVQIRCLRYRGEKNLPRISNFRLIFRDKKIDWFRIKNVLLKMIDWCLLMMW